MSMVHPDRVHAAEMKLAEDPHDIESWQMLIKNAQCRNIDEARDTYERLVDAFPTCGRYWKLYIEQEVSKESHVGDVGGVLIITLILGVDDTHQVRNTFI